jgi:hypothetical protein
MNLRDRLRRWWSPAQWEEDHPLEAAERQQREKMRLGGGFSDSQTGSYLGPSGRPGSDRDFKKPR